MTEKNEADLFDFLDKLAELDKEALQKHHSAKNVAILRKLANGLNDKMVVPDDVTASVFADLIYQLRKIKRTWSRKLGDIIIMASENKAQGDLNGAVLILEKFVKECSSSFYRNIAITQIHNYTTGSGT